MSTASLSPQVSTGYFGGPPTTYSSSSSMPVGRSSKSPTTSEHMPPCSAGLSRPNQTKLEAPSQNHDPKLLTIPIGNLSFANTPFYTIVQPLTSAKELPGKSSASDEGQL